MVIFLKMMNDSNSRVGDDIRGRGIPVSWWLHSSWSGRFQFHEARFCLKNNRVQQLKVLAALPKDQILLHVAKLCGCNSSSRRIYSTLLVSVCNRYALTYYMQRKHTQIIKNNAKSGRGKYLTLPSVIHMYTHTCTRKHKYMYTHLNATLVLLLLFSLASQGKGMKI